MGLDYFIPEKDKFNLDELPENYQKGYIAFVIAGTYFTKKIPVEKIIEVCNYVQVPVILLGGKYESEEGEKVVKQSTGTVLNFAGKINLNQSATLVKGARVVLTNDTGLMHIGAAFGKKILTFWGNTVPEFGMYPYQPHPNSKNMELKDLKCRPCSKLGFEKCPKKHFKCMNEMNMDEVTDWVNKNFN